MLELPINMYDPRRDFKEHENEYRSAIDSVLQRGDFINGEDVLKLENSLAEYTQAPNVITCANGTDAIYISLLGLDIGYDDEVITVAHTWISTAETIAMTGAKPVWVDIDPITFYINTNLIEQKITSKTKAILVVSLYGLIPELDIIKTIANKYNIYLIEDGAQSFGAVRDGYKSCSCKWTDVATTSFFPSKPLGCYGDGGAIFVKNKELSIKIRAIKSHGALERFNHKYIGLNSRLDTIQASILLVKMKYLDLVLEDRNKCAEKYSNELKNLTSIKLPTIPTGTKHVWAQYSILASSKEERDRIVNGLKKNGVNVSIFYPKPLSKQECFKNIESSDLYFTEYVCDRVFNLPCYGQITCEEQNYIINVIKTLV